MYDVVIAGGSVAGLLAARQIAEDGHTVLVLEEGFEIGTPEHCGGLVSKKALNELGIELSIKSFDSKITNAKVFSSDGKYFEIDSTNQQIVVVNRRELDKQIARQAKDAGSTILVKTSFQGKIPNGVKTSNGDIDCKYFIDCRGVSALANKDRDGVYLTAQYEVYADWINDGVVEVYLDQEKYPGFFAWIIPSGDGVGKVGVSGKNINTSKIIQEFLERRGKFSIIRKIYAPIWIKGPIKEFVNDNTIIAGDAAGQAKPTTAGGIYSCGMAGIMAGNAIARALRMKDSSKLLNYEKVWREKFGNEFEKQIMARKILSRINNQTISKLFDSITPEIINEISAKEDFDFHTSSIIKLLGVKGSLSAAQSLISGELKKLVTHQG